MTMSIMALEILEQSQMPPAYARAIAKAIEADSAARREDLVTRTELKAGLAQLKSELRVEIQQVKSDLIRWMFSALTGQTMLMMGIMYFLLRNFS